MTALTTYSLDAVQYSDSLSVLNVSTLLPAGMLLYNTSKAIPSVNAAVSEAL